MLARMGDSYGKEAFAISVKSGLKEDSDSEEEEGDSTPSCMNLTNYLYWNNSSVFFITLTTTVSTTILWSSLQCR
jgi:hypothetical protein